MTTLAISPRLCAVRRHASRACNWYYQAGVPNTPLPDNIPLARARQRRASPRITALYLLAILREFRWTLAALSLAVLIGALVFSRCTVDGVTPNLLTSIYAAWMALLAQPIYNPPPTTSLLILCAIYPLIGAVLIGEGVVRLALLMMSRRRGEKEWMRVMVSTYSNHIIICGLGHLGIRVVEQLLSAGATVVALEQHKTGRFVTQARDLGVPVLIRDMKEDQALHRRRNRARTAPSSSPPRTPSRISRSRSTPSG